MWGVWYYLIDKFTDDKKIDIIDKLIEIENNEKIILNLF